ncbi:MAG TPA: hypothetical protein VIM80_03205 [Brevefilum sp.]
MGRDNERGTSPLTIFTGAICSSIELARRVQPFWRSVPPDGLSLLDPDSLTDGLLLLP